MLIVTNYPRFPQAWAAANGLSGRSVAGRSVADFYGHRGPENIWLVNCNPSLTFRLAALKTVAPRAASLVAADLILRVPATPAARGLLPSKRLLLSRVDHFIHHFRDLSAYERIYKVSADRSSFVPFKVNLVDRFNLEPTFDGDYVLCLGRSLRDFDTFFEAMERLPYPAAIPNFDPALLSLHGGRLTRRWDALPPNVRVVEDDGSDESLVRILRAAKLVVIPVLKVNMVASGISTALNAMALGKCVIGSEGPGISDVFTREVLTAPPEDPAALAAVIRRAWGDDSLRRSTAEAGLRYARKAGGERELYQRIIDRVATWRVERQVEASSACSLSRRPPGRCT